MGEPIQLSPNDHNRIDASARFSNFKFENPMAHPFPDQCEVKLSNQIAIFLKKLIIGGVVIKAGVDVFFRK